MTPARIARFLWIFATRGALLLLCAIVGAVAIYGLCCVFGDWVRVALMPALLAFALGYSAWTDSRKP